MFYGFPPFHKLMIFCEDKRCLRIAVLKDDIKEFMKNANTDGFLRLDYYYFVCVHVDINLLGSMVNICSFIEILYIIFVLYAQRHAF